MRRQHAVRFLAALALLLLISSGAAPAAAGGTWSQFRGSPAKTGLSSDTSSLRSTGWTFETASHNQFVASPVGDSVQVVAAEYGGTVSSLDVVDGSLRWTYRSNDIITATPAIQGDLVIVPSGKRLLALKVGTTGGVQVHWTFNAPGRIDSSPTIAGEAVFVGSDDRNVYKLNLTTGELVWNFSAQDAVKSSPAVVGDAVYFGSFDQHLYALQDNGSAVSLRWRYAVQGEIAGTPAVAGDKVIAATLNGKVVAVDAVRGSKVWEASPGGVIVSSPAVAGSRLFVGGDTLAALDLSTGQLLWERQLTGYVRSSPAILSGVVFVGDYGGRVFAYEVDGSVAWSYDTGSAIRTSPAVGAGLLFVGNDGGRFFAIPLDPGEPPRVTILQPRTTFVGVQESFEALAFDPEAKDLFYTWSFGDAAGASGKSVRHAYGTPGNYTVTLTVSDGALTKQVSAVVTVKPFESAVTGGTQGTSGGSNTLPAGAIAAAVLGAAAASAAVFFVLRARRRRSPAPTPPVPESAPGPAATIPVQPAAAPPALVPDSRRQAELDYYRNLYGTATPPGAPAPAARRPPRPPAPK